jgi:SMODS-associating 2TM, beta-strand rich effector domain
MIAEIQVWTIVGVASVIWLALSIIGVTSGGSVGAVVGLSDIIPLLLLGMSIFERWGWRWQRLHPYIVPVPMVRGTWRGELVSLWVDPTTKKTRPPKTVYLAIEQTMTTIRTRLLTDESESDPIVAAVAKMPNGYRAISYTYENTPRIGLRRKSPPHRGGALLTIHGEPPNRIVGEYWTARDSQGELTLTSRSPEVAQSFEEAQAFTF